MHADVRFDSIETHEEAQAFFSLSRQVGRTMTTVQMRLAPAGLRLETWAALDVLARSPMSMSALAGAIGVSKVAMTRWTPRLCEKGYIRRSVSNGDRRVSLLEITVLGRRVWDSAGREVVDALSAS